MKKWLKPLILYTHTHTHGYFNRQKIRYIKLIELFYIKNGYTPSTSVKEYWNDGDIPWFKMEDIRTSGRILEDSITHITKKAVKGNLFPENSIIISTSATIGEHALIKVKSLANQRFTYMVLKEKYREIINIKYLYYYCFLLGDYCKNNLNSGNFNSVDMNAFKRFEFKIPSLEIQENIVSILDKFDKLTNSISEGLPAEIEARQKQYEYYRNKLLTFKELKTA